jgi:hypothetical protein
MISIKRLIFEAPYRTAQKPAPNNLDIDILISDMIQQIAQYVQEYAIFVTLNNGLKSPLVLQTMNNLRIALEQKRKELISSKILPLEYLDPEAFEAKLADERGWTEGGIENRLFQITEKIGQLEKQYRILSVDDERFKDVHIEKLFDLLIKYLKNKRNDILTRWHS